MNRLQKVSVVIIAAVVGLSFTQVRRAEKSAYLVEDPAKIYTEKCASCHGEKVEAFVDRKWKYGNTKADLAKSIKGGYADLGMPAWGEVLSAKEVDAVADLIVESLKTVEQYSFTKEKKKAEGPAIFKSEGITLTADTIATGLSSPWGFEQLPDYSFLVTDRNGSLYHIDGKGNKTKIEGVPEVQAEGQGGLLDIAVHPQHAQNGWVYISYSKSKMEDGKKLSSTAVSRGKIKDGRFVDHQLIFEAYPYTTTKHHFGSRLVFDKKGYLFISVGERGQHTVFPQDLKNAHGKIHRVHDDGSIPKDNPFLSNKQAIASIYAYGNRNPQGMAMDPATGLIWEHEHGPRGGDELNLIKRGANYGWPVISYGINYDGKPITPISKKEGMEQPVTYWIPSIAPSGFAFVNSDKYPAWKNNILVGSLRFNYVNRCIMKDNKVVGQEKVLLNIGRVRNVEMGLDGYLYVGVEGPGTVLRLRPTQTL